MILDTATLLDRKELEHIWTICFDVDKTFLDLFFDGCFQNAQTYIIRDGQKIVSCLTAIPTYLNTKTNRYLSAYIYGVCTHPHYRGQGLMKLLLSEAEVDLKKKGFLFSYLKPAGASLYNLYAQSGYRQIIYHRQDILNMEGRSFCFLPDGKYRTTPTHIDLQQLNVLRRTSGNTYIEWPEEMLRYLLKYYTSYGYKVMISDEKYVIMSATEPQKKEIAILESNFGHSPKDLRELEKLVLNQYPTTQKIIVNSYTGKKSDHYTTISSGLIKKLGNFSIRNFYLSFPME